MDAARRRSTLFAAVRFFADAERALHRRLGFRRPADRVLLLPRLRGGAPRVSGKRRAPPLAAACPSSTVRHPTRTSRRRGRRSSPRTSASKSARTWSSPRRCASFFVGEPVHHRAVQLPQRLELCGRGAVDGEGDDDGVVVAPSRRLRGGRFEEKFAKRQRVVPLASFAPGDSPPAARRWPSWS